MARYPRSGHALVSLLSFSYVRPGSSGHSRPCRRRSQTATTYRELGPTDLESVLASRCRVRAVLRNEHESGAYEDVATSALRDAAQRQRLRRTRGDGVAMRIGPRSGSVAASTCAMPLSADTFQDSLVMELAMRSARSGSVAAGACAMSLSARAFADTRW